MSHRRAKKTRCRQRQILIEAGATNKEAKAEMAEAEAPDYNFAPEDLDGNRSERRERRFKKRRHAAALEQASFRNRMHHLAKWKQVFTKQKETA